MPECAQNCLLSAVAAAGITSANLDLASSCSNTTATAKIEACSIQACTIREQLTAKNLTETLCQRPVRDAPTISVASIVGGICVLIAFTMRMLSKIRFPCDKGSRIDTDLWWDDFTITVAFVLLIPITILSNVLTGLGIGKDVWTIPFENITQALKVYYVDELLYLTALPTIKIAILCTYLRIFPTRTFRVVVFVAIGFNVAYAITFIIITIFQCNPVSLAWTHWDETHPGTCNNVNAQSWASAIINIVLDLVVVGLPMPVLWNMNLNTRKKLLVMLMFGVGFFVTIVSILRLRLLVVFGDSKNLTYDYKQVGYWTVIEVDTALCCACMPGIRNLIRRAFPKLMGTSIGNSNRVATPGLSGLSGHTAVGGSGIDKNGTGVYVRPRHDDDDHFIPLQNVSTEGLSTTDRDSVPKADKHQRDISRTTYSPDQGVWRPVSPA
ncbi:hypothetical protein M409DRAFT_68300 [Zasmidium cellare ATCC 36951]|uniref:Uncharacterized protein n=1 Tax=Zasmidium cellare ATCC 36951 TaxID=1080233 RepID=A0A6A6C9K3_ZASCE|nr:uncharacterized protein M409DRAFT_68300 [Zasmidium cellare ATCC 36951]KAF2163705.1 hypothetical protein M409DRAFT_68300 [Zasmidium cellare ATCC 36951]